MPYARGAQDRRAASRQKESIRIPKLKGTASVIVAYSPANGFAVGTSIDASARPAGDRNFGPHGKRLERHMLARVADC